MKDQKDKNGNHGLKSMKNLSWAAVATSGALAYGGQSNAEIIGEFTGIVEDISGPAALLDFFDGPFVGSYRLDATTPDSNGSISNGTYAAITDYRVELRSGYTVSSTSGDISVEDTSSGTDLYQVFSNSLIGSPGNIAGVTLSPKQMQLQLSDSSGAALSSDALPFILDLDDFDSGQFTLALEWGFFDIDIEAELTSFTVVPEPATLTLLGVCGLSLLRLRSRPADSVPHSAAEGSTP